MHSKVDSEPMLPVQILTFLESLKTSIGSRIPVCLSSPAEAVTKSFYTAISSRFMHTPLPSKLSASPPFRLRSRLHPAA